MLTLPGHTTGHADFPHPALGQDLTPSPTARRYRARSNVRARSARKGARVDKILISGTPAPAEAPRKQEPGAHGARSQPQPAQEPNAGAEGAFPRRWVHDLQGKSVFDGESVAPRSRDLNLLGTISYFTVTNPR
jgi:hypothetical protein